MEKVRINKTIYTRFSADQYWHAEEKKSINEAKRANGLNGRTLYSKDQLPPKTA